MNQFIKIIRKYEHTNFLALFHFRMKFIGKIQKTNNKKKSLYKEYIKKIFHNVEKKA